MAIYKNAASQKIGVYAYDPTVAAGTDPSKTGDAANITAQISLDGGVAAATNDVNPTELEATDQPGIYLFDLTQAETNADVIHISAVSATSNILLDPVQILTLPGSGAALIANPATGGIVATSFFAGAIDSTAIANNALGESQFQTSTFTANLYHPDFTTEIQAGLATEAKQDILDTVVDAIKAITDQFVFTVANQVDANALTSVATASAGSFEAYQGARNVESTIYSKLKDTSVIAVTVLDSNGDAVDLTGKTLKLVVEDADGTDIATQDTVTETSTGFSFAPTAAMVASVVDDWSWSAYDTADGDADCGSGPWIVQYRAYAD